MPLCAPPAFFAGKHHIMERIRQQAQTVFSSGPEHGKIEGEKPERN
jgi:hypothetical protein